MPDLMRLLDRLTRHRVDFVVIGGMAGVAHGVGLVTYDLDICMEFSVEELLRLRDALADLHPVHRMTPKRLPLKLDADFAIGLKNLYLDTDCGQLDCLSSVLGVGDFRTVKEDSVLVSLEKHKVRVLSLDALIRAKEALTRERDREALIRLRAIREKLSDRR